MRQPLRLRRSYSIRLLPAMQRPIHLPLSGTSKSVPQAVRESSTREFFTAVRYIRGEWPTLIRAFARSHLHRPIDTGIQSSYA